jgi:hypothetical protein
MATAEDAGVVSDLVADAARLLDWCAGPEALITWDDGEDVPAVPPDLLAGYAAAVDQLAAEQVALALSTLAGGNDSFPIDRVLAVLARAGWDGALRDFKLQVLEQTGRAEVRERTAGGRAGGGRIRRALLGPFMGALNAALDSLTGVPGVAAIKELKDFLERILGR